MPAKTCSLKTVGELCKNLRRCCPEVFASLRQLLKEWQDSEDTESCLGQLTRLLTDRKEAADMVNAFLEDEVKIHAVAFQTIQEVNSEIIRRLKGMRSKSRMASYRQFLEDHRHPDHNESTLLPLMLEHFEDLPEFCALIRFYSEQRARPQEPVPEDSKGAARDEIEYFNSLAEAMSRGQFEFLVKLLFLYYNCIMGKHDILQLATPELFDRPADHEFFRQLVQATEISRRKSTPFFKPLNDIDFSKSMRATHSYVKMPEMYPIKCRGKEDNPLLRSVLNDKWVSVPVGSEHETFNIHSKNQFEEALIKSEDERYELDIFMNRTRRICVLLETIIGLREPDPRHRLLLDGRVTCNIDSTIEEVAELNVLQAFYRNVYKEDKVQIEIILKHNPVSACEVLLERLQQKYHEFEQVRNLAGARIWREIAEKNFKKSLDRKGIEFKKIDKTLTKEQTLIKELECNLSEKL